MVLHDLVVEDGEVERQTELDRIAGRQLNLVSFCISA